MEQLTVFIDGGSKGNPGPAGIGIVIYKKGEKVKDYSKFIGRTTNNQAEYIALIFALKKIKALYGKKEIKNFLVRIKSDSELMVEQMRGNYKIKDKKIQPLFLKAWNLKLDFGKVRFDLIPRTKNKEADKLVNQALKQKKLI